jgi:hypothetical protein
MTRLLLFLWPLWLFADPLALYLSWYGDPTTTMTIQWHTSIEEASDVVEIQPLLGEWTKVEGSHLELSERLVHKVELTNLSPDTEYSFRFKDKSIYKFRTAPSILKEPLRFVIGGDLYQSEERFREMCRTVKELDPLFAVLGGDIAYAINANPFRLHSSAKKRWFSFLQEWKEEMISPEGQVIPLLIVPGNHDIAPDKSDLFFDLFAFPDKTIYRAIDFGNYLSLILLDTELAPIEGKQTDWLNNALDERKGIPFCFPVYHKAAYPSVYSFTGEIPQKIRTHWCPLFDRYGIPVAFEHHNHTFKRTYPLKGNKKDASGVIYLGDGCWGATPRSPKDRWYLEKREKKNNVYFLELSPKSAKIEAIGLGGEKIDGLEIPAKLK